MARRARGAKNLDRPEVAILAGGRGRRLGGAKTTADLAGRPLISYPVAAARAAGLEPLVVAKPDTKLPPLDSRLIREEADMSHPVAGLVAALEAAERGVVALACDMPFVPPGLLRWIADLDAPLAVSEVDGRLEPLLARYPPAAARPLRRALHRGAALREAVQDLQPTVIAERELARFGEPRWITFNVNSPPDLAAAAGMIRERAFGTAGAAG